MRRYGLFVLALGALLGTFAFAQAALAGTGAPLCQSNSAVCTEVVDSLGSYYSEFGYTGHDEPSLLFYSDVGGSGNSQIYKLTLPREPAVPPAQDGTGGTASFQLHPAFWFGVDMCDTQSSPEFQHDTCIPDSDLNIFDNPSKSAPDYIGHHPGGAFMEMQFYPPGWVKWPPGTSCHPTRWCAALNIDSFNLNQLNNILNNGACLDAVGLEPVNFAFITRSGVPTAPPDPITAFGTGGAFTPEVSKDLLMQGGDTIVVDLHDTPAGLQIVIHDLTSGQSGSMTASAANGFAQVNYQPSSSTCTETPYNFHPMYATSSEHTRLTWTAHGYNVAYSDEIGHFEYCNAVDQQGGGCTQPGVNDSSLDGDDAFCFAPGFLPPLGPAPFKIGGCLATDVDFDGVPYQQVWPGTSADPSAVTTPITFTSPLFNGSQNYSRVAFEADLPRIEIPALSPNNNCNRTTGVGCVNPPIGANFYPMFVTGSSGGQCVWEEGGPAIPGATNTFGGSSTTEFGPLLKLFYPSSNLAGVVFRFNDFRNTLASNPCPA